MTHLDGAHIDALLKRRFDAVVVGTGAGGAVAACTLAEAGLTVALVEEGPYVTGEQMTGRPLEMFDLLYRNKGLTGTVGYPPIPVPLGRAVGGTTLINSATCFRTPDNVLTRWEGEFGLAGATALAPFYDQVECDLDIKPVPDAIYGAQSRRFEAASVALGYKGRRIPRNERDCAATGVCAVGCPRDAKQSMAVSYVPRALRAGAVLLSNARVDRLTLAGRRATGVTGTFLTPQGASRGIGFELSAPLVVVAAGALNTPPLLLKSGVKGKRIGRNLHMHPATRVLAKFPEVLHGWAEVPQAYNVDEFIDEGIFIQGQFVSPPIQAPNVPGFGAAHLERMSGFDRWGSFGALISDESAGRVFANGVAYYKLNRKDTEKLRRGIAITTDIFLEAGAEEVFTGVAVQPVVRSKQDAERLLTAKVHATDIEMMAFHPMGTAAVGRDPGQGAVDAYGKLFGYEGLYVADTGLFPTSNRINPQLTLMALSLRNAREWARTR